MTYEYKAGEEYRTRRGDRARVYATGTGGRYTIHGAIYRGGEWTIEEWETDGCYYVDGGCGRMSSPLDLMPPKPKPREVWIWDWHKDVLDTEACLTESDASFDRDPDHGHAVKFREVLEDE